MKKFFLILCVSGNLFGMQRLVNAALSVRSGLSTTNAGAIGILNQAADRLREFRFKYRQHATPKTKSGQFELNSASGLHIFHYLQSVYFKDLSLEDRGRFAIAEEANNICDSISKLSSGGVVGEVREPFSCYNVGKWDEVDIFLYLRMAETLANGQNRPLTADTREILDVGNKILDNFKITFKETAGVLPCDYFQLYKREIPKGVIETLKKEVSDLKLCRHIIAFSDFYNSPFIYKFGMLNGRFKDYFQIVGIIESDVRAKKEKINQEKKQKDWEKSIDGQNWKAYCRAKGLLGVIEHENWHSWSYVDLKNLIVQVKDLLRYCDVYGDNYYSSHCRAELSNLEKVLRNK